MAAILKKSVDDEPQIHKIRITLTSRNVKAVEKGKSAHTNAMANRGSRLPP